MPLYPLNSPSHVTEFILSDVKRLTTWLYPVTRLKIRGSLGPFLSYLHDILLMHRHTSTRRLAIVNSTVNCVFDSFCIKIKNLPYTLYLRVSEFVAAPSTPSNI